MYTLFLNYYRKVITMELWDHVLQMTSQMPYFCELIRRYRVQHSSHLLGELFLHACGLFPLCKMHEGEPYTITFIKNEQYLFLNHLVLKFRLPAYKINQKWAGKSLNSHVQ